ncbi:MAG: DUF1385 domain-containing protein [Dehalococcoidia bacterium]|nr:DUF1385 domain-containing protein [Dehalococcoidia bacterium]
MPGTPIPLGGQAVVEGVMIRGPRTTSIVARRPDGSLATRIQRHPAAGLARVARRIPLVRGIFTILETVVMGMRALAWSSAVAAGQANEGEEPPSLGVAGGIIVGLSFGFAVTVFFVGPAAATVWLDGRLSPVAVALLEGGLRLALLIGYVWNAGRSPQIGRVFQYHGAEHMAIQAHEHGLALTTASVRRFEKEHPRCGTSFLLTVVVVSMLVFLPFDGGPLWWRLGSRLALIPVVAAVSYEVIRLGARYSVVPVVRWLFIANIALQRLTTRVPDDEHMQVAIAAVQRCLEAERAASLAPH